MKLSLRLNCQVFLYSCAVFRSLCFKRPIYGAKLCFTLITKSIIKLSLIKGVGRRVDDPLKRRYQRQHLP